MKKAYIGPKQTTIANTNFFDFSLTLFGENSSKNFSYEKNLTFEYWNPDNALKEKYIYNNLLSKLSEPFEIMGHDPLLISECEIPKNISQICLNDVKLLKVLNNKIETRSLLKNVINTLDYQIILGHDFDYDNLIKKFGENMVVQSPFGSGGSKTFLCTPKNYLDIQSILSDNKNYSVSRFLEENIPYNVHCVIGEKIDLFAPSIQELEIIDKIEFIGSKYVNIDKGVKQKMIEQSMNICCELKKLGYLGVLGIDYIYSNKELFFMEINPRFQGSTKDLDLLLSQSNLPSIFEYNYNAFKGIKTPTAKNMINSIFDN